jgi:hypothetical protein
MLVEQRSGVAIIIRKNTKVLLVVVLYTSIHGDCRFSLLLAIHEYSMSHRSSFH